MDEHALYSALIETCERFTGIEWFRAFAGFPAPETEQYGTIWIGTIDETDYTIFNKNDPSFTTIDQGTVKVDFNVYNRGDSGNYPSSPLQKLKRSMILDEVTQEDINPTEQYQYSIHSFEKILNTRDYNVSVNQPSALLRCVLWWADTPMTKATQHIETVEGMEATECIHDNNRSTDENIILED